MHVYFIIKFQNFYIFYTLVYSKLYVECSNSIVCYNRTHTHIYNMYVY